MKKTLILALGLCLANSAAFADASIGNNDYNFPLYQLYLPTDENLYIQYSVTFCLKSDPYCVSGPKTPQNLNGDPNFYSNPTFTTGCIPLSTPLGNTIMAGNTFIQTNTNVYNLFYQATHPKTDEDSPTAPPLPSVSTIYVIDMMNNSTVYPNELTYGPNTVSCTTPNIPKDGICTANIQGGDKNRRTPSRTPLLLLHGGPQSACKASTIESDPEHLDLTGIAY